METNTAQRKAIEAEKLALIARTRRPTEAETQEARLAYEAAAHESRTKS